MEHAGTLGDLLVLVLSRDTRVPHPHELAAAVPNAELAQERRNHDDAQEALAHLSTRGRRIIARGSSHYIHFDRPELVVREVNPFVQRLREVRDQPGAGITLTE